MKEYKSVYPFDCSYACGLILSVDNNKVISVRGDRAHAFTRGTLCPKMAHYEKVIHSPLRLKYPMKRVGKKGIGEAQYTRISWDEALDAIVNNFKKLLILMAVKVFCVTLMQEQWGLFRVLQQIIFFAVFVLQTKIAVFALMLIKRGSGPFMVKP